MWALNFPFFRRILKRSLSCLPKSWTREDKLPAFITVCASSTSRCLLKGKHVIRDVEGLLGGRLRLLPIFPRFDFCLLWKSNPTNRTWLTSLPESCDDSWIINTPDRHQSFTHCTCLNAGYKHLSDWIPACKITVWISRKQSVPPLFFFFFSPLIHVAVH